MTGVPQNLLYLHQGEEQLRTKALDFIQMSPDMQAHLAITERAMNLLDVFVRQQVEDTDDGRAIQHLGIRVFNGFAAAWKLMSTGYFQKAGLVQRDLIETIYLVNFFHIHPNKVSVWRVANRKQLLNEFGPGPVRKALDAHAGMGKSRRDEIYQKFSMLAAHPSKLGFDMLRPKGGNGAVIGPFMDVTALKALLEEQGQLAPQAGLAFSMFLKDDEPDQRIAIHSFMTASMRYAVRYLGMRYTEEDVAEVDRLFGPKR